jgi:hypothetical protein
MNEQNYLGNSKSRKPLLATMAMAFTTVSQLVEHIDDLSLASPYDAGKGMKMLPIRFQGAPLHLKLSSDNDLSVPWEPSSWGGNTEPRKSITFNIPQPVFEALAELEDWCRQVLEDTHPAIQALWISRVKPAEKYPATLAAKINLAGPRQARFYDQAAQPTEPPTSWRGLAVNAVVHVKGVYIQKQSIGLVLDVTDLRYAAPPERVCPF